MLQDKFASGYYQDYIKDRHAEEAVIKPKPKRGGRGSKAKAPRWLGERPGVDPGVQFGDGVEVELDDNGGGVHLDDEGGGVPIMETTTLIDDDQVGCQEAVDAREQSLELNIIQ